MAFASVRQPCSPHICPSVYSLPLNVIFLPLRWAQFRQFRVGTFLIQCTAALVILGIVIILQFLHQRKIQFSLSTRCFSGDMNEIGWMFTRKADLWSLHS